MATAVTASPTTNASAGSATSRWAAASSARSCWSSVSAPATTCANGSAGVFVARGLAATRVRCLASRAPLLLAAAIRSKILPKSSRPAVALPDVVFAPRDLARAGFLLGALRLRHACFPCCLAAEPAMSASVRLEIEQGDALRSVVAEFGSMCHSAATHAVPLVDRDGHCVASALVDIPLACLMRNTVSPVAQRTMTTPVAATSSISRSSPHFTQRAMIGSPWRR
jgi:hypothetical protein